MKSNDDVTYGADGSVTVSRAGWYQVGWDVLPVLPQRMPGKAFKESGMMPFGSITPRPYDQAILSDVDWYKIEPTYVHVSDLNLTQTHCTILGLFGQKYSTDPHIRVVLWEGRLYVEDGHHRLVKEALDGHRAALVRICEAA